MPLGVLTPYDDDGEAFVLVIVHCIRRTSWWSLTCFTDIALLSVLNVCFRCLCQTLPVCGATEVIYVVLLCVNRPMFVYFCSILSMYLYMFCVV